MKQISLKVLLLVFFLFTLGAAVYSGNSRKSIMIVHSYYTDYAWTNEVNIGIERALEKYPHLEVVTYYMDTKKMVRAESKEKAGQKIRRLIDDSRPSVLVLVDDDAQEYVGKHLVDNDYGMAIVFAGVNYDFAEYYCAAGQGQETRKCATGSGTCNDCLPNHVSGIMEKKSASSIHEIIQIIHNSQPGVASTEKIRVTFLSDESGSVIKDHKNLSKQTEQWNNIVYNNRRVATLDDWKKAVETLSETEDYILISGYRKLRKKDSDGFATAQEVMCAALERTRKPLIGLNFFNSEEGAHLSIGVSPYQQGQAALTRAIEIVEGKRFEPENSLIETEIQYIVSINQQSADRLSMHLPGLLRAFAHSNGHYYDRHFECQSDAA